MNIGDYKNLGWVAVYNDYSSYVDTVKKFNNDRKITVRKWGFRYGPEYNICWGIVITNVTKNNDAVWFKISKDNFALVLLELVESYIDIYGFKSLVHTIRNIPMDNDYNISPHVTTLDALNILLEEGIIL